MANLLLVGSVDNAADPAAAQAVLYAYGTSYGLSEGTDVPLLIETTDLAPLGASGKTLFRRLQVPVQYVAACAVSVTPQVDYNTAEPLVVVTYPAPLTTAVTELSAALAVDGTTIGGIIQVTARAGPVRIGVPTALHQPRTGAYPLVVQTT